MDQLEGLGDELHLADTAFAQLDVFRHPLAPDLLLDQLLHGAQRLDGGEVQVAPIDERPQHAEQLLACLLVAADHPRLDHRVALPVAPLVLVVLLQRGEAVDQRSAGAVGTQAHVDAEDEASTVIASSALISFCPRRVKNSWLSSERFAPSVSPPSG